MGLTSAQGLNCIESVMKNAILTILTLLMVLPVVPVTAKPATTIAIEDSSGKALSAFHESLLETKHRRGQTRILFFGASHTAGEIMTGLIRRKLQGWFGDAGHGFVLPARPWTNYRHSDVNIESTNTWHTDRVSKPDDRMDGWYGLAAMSVSSSDPNDFGKLWTTTDNPVGQSVSVFDLYYLAQPNGGSLDILIDGRRVRKVRTKTDDVGPKYEVFRVRDGGHSFEIRPVGDGEVRIFGVAMDRRVPGVILDTLGIPGTRAEYHLQTRENLLTDHIQRRDPDLVVLAYGTNESGDDDVPIEDYEARLVETVNRFKMAAPNASCLLVGPSDRPLQATDGSWGPRPRTAQVIEVQRRVSVNAGCGFFDTVAFMGGEMAMLEWIDQGLGSSDHVHFTVKGYELMGQTLLNTIMKGYWKFKRSKTSAGKRVRR